MKVLDPNTIVCSSGLLSVEEVDGGVRITVKNKNTLTGHGEQKLVLFLMSFPIIYVCLFMVTPYLLIFSYLRLCHDPRSEIKLIELDAPESIN